MVHLLSLLWSSKSSSSKPNSRSRVPLYGPLRVSFFSGNVNYSTMTSIASSQSGAEPKMIANGLRVVPTPATPNTLAKLEDPRAWHARGEVGIVQLQKSSRKNKPNSMIAMPMAPPLAKGRAIPSTKKVLEEDEYVERLGDIIESDYFPHNSKMTRALAGLGGAAVGVTPSRGFVATPSSTGFSTPGRATPNGGNSGGEGGEEGAVGKAGGGKAREAGGGGALTKFVATHTSEDNQAFAELQEKDQEDFRRRYFWAYDNAEEGEGNNCTATKLLILPNGKMMSVERRELMDEACADRPKMGDHRPNQVETWKHRTRNQLMFLPTLAASNDICRIEAAPESGAPLLLEGTLASKMPMRSSQKLIEPQATATRRESSAQDEASTAQSDSCDEISRSKHAHKSPGVKKSLASMSAADDDRGSITVMEEPLSRTDDSNEEKDLKQLEATRPNSMATVPVVPRAPIVLRTNAKVIQAHATRFPVPKVRPRRVGSWASPIESPSSSRESVKGLLAGGGNGDMPEYSEVPMTPSRVPGVDGDSPQITWGSIDGTPMILDPRMTPLPDGSLPGTMSAIDIASVAVSLGTASSSGGRQFEIRDLPARDKLAHRLEADDTRRKRARPSGASGVDNDRGTALRPPGSSRTPLTSRTPGTGRRTTSGVGTPSIGRRRDSASKESSSASTTSATLTPAGRTLAAKLVSRRGGDTPFGGALTPGPQKKRHRSTRGGGSRGQGLTPLPCTPGTTPVGGARARLPTPVGGVTGRLRQGGGENKAELSLTDGLLAMK